MNLKKNIRIACWCLLHTCAVAETTITPDIAKINQLDRIVTFSISNTHQIEKSYKASLASDTNITSEFIATKHLKVSPRSAITVPAQSSKTIRVKVIGYREIKEGKHIAHLQIKTLDSDSPPLTLPIVITK